MKVSTLLGLVALVGTLALCAVSITARVLLFGWIDYLVGIVPRLAPHPPTVLISLAAAGLLLLGVHSLGRRIVVNGRVWRWRYSASVTAMTFVLFAASVAMVGIVHMSIWYATDPEPIRDVPALYRIGARVKSANNMKQIGLALHNHHDIWNCFPAAATYGPKGELLHGWEIQTALTLTYSTKGIDFNVPWDNPKNARYFQCVLPEFINPSLPGAPIEDERGFGLNHYSANSHLFKPKQSLMMSEVTDGLSNTIMFGEINTGFQPWGKPMNVRDPARGINRSPRGFGGPPGRSGAMMAMADGSVRFISEAVSPEVLRALATPAGGETVDERDLDK